jgi:hypothetical protein
MGERHARRDGFRLLRSSRVDRHKVGYLTLAEVADLLQVSVPQLLELVEFRRLCASICSRKFGSCLPARDFEEWTLS